MSLSFFGEIRNRVIFEWDDSGSVTVSFSSRTHLFSGNYIKKQKRPRGYKTFLMLNSTLHEISTDHKNYFDLK